jgi:hypothetical protein
VLIPNPGEDVSLDHVDEREPRRVTLRDRNDRLRSPGLGRCRVGLAEDPGSQRRDRNAKVVSRLRETVVRQVPRIRGRRLPRLIAVSHEMSHEPDPTVAGGPASIRGAIHCHVYCHARGHFRAFAGVSELLVPTWIFARKPRNPSKNAGDPGGIRTRAVAWRVEEAWPPPRASAARAGKRT